eukprot:jgi/Psemu1/288093/fgenesh1_pg.235_\
MAGIVSIRQGVSFVTTLVGTHVAFSVASIARAGIGGLPKNDTPKGTIEKQECFDAKHYDMVTDWVGRMYRGRGVKSVNNNKNNNNSCGGNGNGSGGHAKIGGVKLSPTATFEDPAAVCIGEEEVREAFRALRVLEPVSINPPKCIDVQPQGESIRLTFLLNQQYTLPFPSLSARNSSPQQIIIQLRSLLHVTVQLQQMKYAGLPESEFHVTEMNELWYGNPLLWPYRLFYVPRRLNGVVSYYLTSRFL